MSMVHSLDASCTTIAGGTIGIADPGEDVSVRADSPFEPALVEITNGTFSGGVSAGSNSRVHITGGSFGSSTSGHSVSADAPSGTAVIVIEIENENGDFSGEVAAGSNSHVHITGGSFGSSISGRSVSADPTLGTALVEIENGDFSGEVAAGSNSHVHITGGSFSTGAYTRSLSADDTALVEIENGVFQGGVEVLSNGRVHITGGSFGTLPFETHHDPLLSIKAHVDSGPETARVKILGGTFSHGLEAGRNGIIDVYGTNLQITVHQINAGILSGTLLDGTPINLPVRTVENGQIILHNPASVSSNL